VPRARRRVFRLSTGLCLAVSLAGCGARPHPCAGEVDCPSDTVCQSDGRCAPLALSPSLRAARAVRLGPASSRSSPSQADGGDAARLGGRTRSVLLLSFDGLVPEARDAGAELVLTLDDAGVSPTTVVTLVVDRVRPPGPTGMPAVLADRVAERRIGPDSRGPIRIDVSRLVRACARDGVRRLDLAVRMEGDAEILVSSARSSDAVRRPRLDLYLP
jgi:hypothetical protein